MKSSNKESSSAKLSLWNTNMIHYFLKTSVASSVCLVWFSWQDIWKHVLFKFSIAFSIYTDAKPHLIQYKFFFFFFNLLADFNQIWWEVRPWALKLLIHFNVNLDTGAENEPLSESPQLCFIEDRSLLPGGRTVLCQWSQTRSVFNEYLNEWRTSPLLNLKQK